MNSVFAFPGKVIERWYSSTFTGWLTTRSWRVALLLGTIAYVFSFPSYDVVLVLHEMTDNWAALFRQAAAPFTDHSALYDPESHSAKLAFRFVPALVLRLLGVDTIIGAYIVQLFLVYLFYWLLFKLIRQLTADPRAAFLLALPICFLIAGHVHASDYRGIFDILALDLLLIAALVRRTVWVIPALILSGFTDERALMATPALILIELYLTATYTSLSTILRASRTRPVLMVLVSWVLYFIMRYALGLAFGLHTASVDLRHYFIMNLSRIPYALYVGLEGYYVLVIMVVTLFLHRKNHAFLLLFGGSFFVLQVFALCVVDINRSLSYLIVWLVLVSTIVFREKPRSQVLIMVGWCVLINLAYSEFLPFPLQLIRMAFVSKTLVPLEGWMGH